MLEINFEIATENFKNGNITFFKEWLGELNGTDILQFIRWLQREGIRL